MVAGERRRPAASSAAETVMGSPPNRTTDGARCPTSARASPNGVTSEIVLSLRHGEADAGRSSTRHPAVVRTGRRRGRDGRSRSRGGTAFSTRPPDASHGSSEHKVRCPRMLRFRRAQSLAPAPPHLNESWFGTTPLLYHR